MTYISTAEANTYLETTGEDTNVADLVTQACYMIDRFCNRESGSTYFAFQADTITNERYKYNWVWPYVLKWFPINSITQINWTTVTLTEFTNYLLEWSTVTFDTGVDLSGYNTTRNIMRISYTKWYATIPNDIKTACKMIVAGLYHIRKVKWVSSFTQWDIQISLDSNWVFGWDSKKYDEICLLLAKYKTINVLS